MSTGLARNFQKFQQTKKGSYTQMYKSYKYYKSILICISEWILPLEGWFYQKWSQLYFCYYTSNKNFILKYFRCRDGKRTETRIGMEGICITHSCIPLYTVYMQHIMAHSGGMQEWVIQIPSIPILVSVLFPSLHLKYFRRKFLLLVCVVFMRMRTKPHPHPVLAKPHPHRRSPEVLAVFALVCTFPAFS